MTSVTWRDVVAVAALVALACLASDMALAQGAAPFGGQRPPAPPPPPDGLGGWIMAKQAEFYRGLSGAVRAAKADGSAVWMLLGLSFAYGVFHAAGPGHGKAVIASYLVANDETWRRGVVLSFASAFLQAAVAVAIVSVAAVLLGATARQMSEAVRIIELVSYFAIISIGLALVWRKGRAFLATLTARARPLLAPGAPVLAHAHAGHGQTVRETVRDHVHDHAHHDAHLHRIEPPGADQFGHRHHSHPVLSHRAHTHSHGDTCSVCGHAHGPDPADLAGEGGWRRGLAAIVAVGLRPCSGAILVLVFALAQGMYWAGIAATFAMGLGTAIAVTLVALLAVSARGLAGRLAQGGNGAGTLVLRGVELAAAGVVLAFGVLLLTGFVASERLFGV